ncbi:alpha/beta fold hydrolase [Chitinophaga filiformis]|uniref:Pimeloyl-ACP methyl ester carboxylesterase n=1 Tax=Chitinophaga filiformis TaxID=104663 RepID=A0A1G7R7M7_CHIFI|nr:alpha/beta hydrolase [Chitinophaga filiformis]SDG06685.1 Pimeloyl-ACP methyl ester carboxylesterase [Chitinophaga filiformis]
MNKHVYLISGMGADERIFRNLSFPGEYTVHYLDWLTPEPQETFPAYAARMAARMEHEDVTLLGVSFGGMLALEIARQRPIQKVILISSIKNTGEKPPYLAWVRKTGLLHLLRLPDAIIFTRRKGLVKLFLNAETAEEQELLAEYMNKTAYGYLRWGIRTVVNWQNDFIPASLVHIHGGKDRTFPSKLIKADYIIPTGGHFMVYNRATEINEILRKELQ